MRSAAGCEGWNRLLHVMSGRNPVIFECIGVGRAWCFALRRHQSSKMFRGPGQKLLAAKLRDGARSTHFKP